MSCEIWGNLKTFMKISYNLIPILSTHLYPIPHTLTKKSYQSQTYNARRFLKHVHRLR
jgi:hypothetical protein